MKKKSPSSSLFLCLILAASFWFEVTNGSGDLGDFGEKVTSLPENEIQKYLSEDLIVGRDKEPEQCSKNVFEFREKMKVISSLFTLFTVGFSIRNKNTKRFVNFPKYSVIEDLESAETIIHQ